MINYLFSALGKVCKNPFALNLVCPNGSGFCRDSLALRLLYSALSVCALLLPSTAQAGTYWCSMGAASGVSVSYDPLLQTPVTAMGTITLNCSKSGSNSDTIYYELGSDGGINQSGGQSQVRSDANAISYGLWRNNAHNQAWTDASNNRIKGAVSGTGNTSVTVNYYLRIPAAQQSAVASYTDTQTVRLYQAASAGGASTAGSSGSATFNIVTATVGQCSLSTPPGNILFNYTSFQTTPASASTSFGVTCVNGVNYTMSLDASTGSLLGLNYALSLNPTGTRTGSGSAQSVSINGSIAAGQSGTCSTSSCSTTEARTLTISY